MIQLLEEKMGEKFYYWKFEDEDGNYVFIMKTRDNSSAFVEPPPESDSEDDEISSPAA